MKDLTFKSVINKDCADIFLNDKEFADSIYINDRQIKAIIDSNELIERNISSPHDDGAFAHTILIYVLASEFGQKPKIEQKITLGRHDKKRTLIVKECTEEQGIYAITAREVKM